MTKGERVQIFNDEWEIREAMLRGAGVDEVSIKEHKKEIMHSYCIQEEDLNDND